jgi:hypothetical protein
MGSFWFDDKVLGPRCLRYFVSFVWGMLRERPSCRVLGVLVGNAASS